jgi:outer membrane biosynthesis protein TonB
MQKVKVLVLLLLTAATAACAGARAQVIEDQPTLVVPPVPPRTIEPQPPTEPPAIEPVPDLSPSPAPAPKPKATAPRTNDSKPEPKPEAQPEATAAAGTTSPPPVEPLRSPTTPSGPEAMRQIQESLARTDNVLSRVDYQKLTPDSKATYDAAKGFKQQAEEALKKDDINQARAFALRAENIAKKLEPR